MRTASLAIFSCLISLAVISVPLLDRSVGAAPGGPGMAVTPRIAAPTEPRTVSVAGLQPNSMVVLVVLEPSGDQYTHSLTTDGSGSGSATLAPPGGGWAVGYYRVAVGLAEGSSMSATFVADDGKPHLYEIPPLPSPTSAFNLAGSRLPPNTSLQLQLLLTGAQGEPRLTVNTDADGTFSAFVWPEEFALPFFAAGDYQVTAPDLGLSADFRVREHPVSSAITVQGPVQAGSEAQVQFRNYGRDRYLWGVYASSDGTPVGEFLVGPTNNAGQADAGIGVAPVPAGIGVAPVPAGTYLMATPYDWGESRFTALAPPATATPTPSPTPPPTPTATPAPPGPVILSLTVNGPQTLRVGHQSTFSVTQRPNPNPPPLGVLFDLILKGAWHTPRVTGGEHCDGYAGPSLRRLPTGHWDIRFGDCQTVGLGLTASKPGLHTFMIRTFAAPLDQHGVPQAAKRYPVKGRGFTWHGTASP